MKLVPSIQFSATLYEQGADAGVFFQRSNHQQRPRILIRHTGAEFRRRMMSPFLMSLLASSKVILLSRKP